MNRKSFSNKSPGKLVPTVSGAWAFSPAPLPPNINLSASLLRLCETATLALGELRSIIPVLPNPALLTQPFLRREAVLSSRIEGTHTRVGQLALFEAEEPTAEALFDRDDAQEVWNYVAALELGLEMLKDLPICERLIKTVHERLMSGVRGERQSPGKYRTTQNFIGRGADIRSARFVPPPPREVAGAMRLLEKFMNSEPPLPYLIQLALIHYQFEAIHPFCDGNGRMGRLLISLLFAARDYLPQPLLYYSDYLERNRDEYVDLMLQVSQTGAWDDWIAFFVAGIREQSSDAVGRAKELLQLRERFRSQFQRRNAATVLSIIDSLFVTPATTVRKAQKLVKTTFNVAGKHIEALEAAGILREVTGQRRDRVFLCDPIVEILEAPAER